VAEIKPFPERPSPRTIKVEPGQLYELYRAFGGGRLNLIMDDEMITIVTDHGALDVRWGDRLVQDPDDGWRIEKAGDA
jgi:hypothetical protein